MKITLISLDGNSKPVIRADYLGRNNHNHSLVHLHLNGSMIELIDVANDSDQIGEPALIVICFPNFYTIFGGEKYYHVDISTNSIISKDLFGREVADEEYWYNDVILLDTSFVFVTESCYIVFDQSGKKIIEGPKMYNEEVLVSRNSLKVFFEDKCVREIEMPSLP